jgi:hypothetical protein
MIENNGGPAAAFHNQVFLGRGHEKSERRTWAVIWLCGVMMVAEIVGGLMFGSIALVADGMHMSTHAGALLLAALAYTYARKHANDPNFTFGTGTRRSRGIHKRHHPRDDRALDRLRVGQPHIQAGAYPLRGGGSDCLPRLGRQYRERVAPKQRRARSRP